VQDWAQLRKFQLSHITSLRLYLVTCNQLINFNVNCNLYPVTDFVVVLIKRYLLQYEADYLISYRYIFVNIMIIDSIVRYYMFLALYYLYIIC